MFRASDTFKTKVVSLVGAFAQNLHLGMPEEVENPRTGLCTCGKARNLVFRAHPGSQPCQRHGVMPAVSIAAKVQQEQLGRTWLLSPCFPSSSHLFGGGCCGCGQQFKRLMNEASLQADLAQSSRAPSTKTKSHDQ